MRRLTIAVDCDDVLIPSMETLVDAYNQRFATNVRLLDAYNSQSPEWLANPEVIAGRIHDIQSSEQYAKVSPFPEAVNACRNLASIHTLHLVTARPERLALLTGAMLKSSFGNEIFSEIKHVGFDGNKGHVCTELGADVLIDDSLKHIQAAAECGISGLIWFGDYPWQSSEDQQSIQQPVIRARNWQEVVQEIEQLANQ